MGGTADGDGALEIGAPALLGALDDPLTDANLTLTSAEDSISSIGGDNVLDLRDHAKREQFKKDGLTMKVGETYKLLLSENPTTGYTWQLNDGLNSDLISLESAFKRDAHAPGMVGVGGVKEITIKALKSGTGKFQAMNSRPWEF